MGHPHHKLTFHDISLCEWCKTVALAFLSEAAMSSFSSKGRRAASAVEPSDDMAMKRMKFIHDSVSFGQTNSKMTVPRHASKPGFADLRDMPLKLGPGQMLVKGHSPRMDAPEEGKE